MENKGCIILYQKGKKRMLPMKSQRCLKLDIDRLDLISSSLDCSHMIFDVKILRLELSSSGIVSCVKLADMQF